MFFIGNSRGNRAVDLTQTKLNFMKNSLLFTVLMGAAFLVSCGSQQNFNSRKYTKGKFRVASKRLKSAKPESKQVQQLATNNFQEELNAPQEESLIQMNLQEESKRSISETIHVDEINSIVTHVEPEPLVKSLSATTAKTSKHQRKPRSEISELKKKEKKKTKKDLNKSQRQARTSLIFGIIGISLAVLLLTLSLLSMPAFPVPFMFFYVSRSIRVALIPAFLGAIFGTFAKFGKEELGKYEKHQRVGFWLSVSTILLWILLM